VPFAIVDCDAPLETLRERLRERTGDASEADARVLDLLAAAREPLADDELG
jgi:predicted kinase